MKKVKVFIPILVLVLVFNIAFLFIFSNNSNVANAYVLNSFHLVDSGKHMDWDGSTKYSSEWSYAVNTWNAVKNVIRPNTWYRVKDVTISDFTDSQSNIVYSCQPSGTIKYNRYYFDQFSANEKKSKVLQSVGNALGIYWNDDTTSAMYYGFGPITLSQDDKAALTWLYNHQY